VPAEFTVIAELTAVVPKYTAVAPLKPAPFMVTDVPPTWFPEFGATDVTTGPYVNLSAATRFDVPPGPVTVTSTIDVALPAGAVAVMDVLELTVKDATADPKLIVVAPVKPLPVMVTASPPPGTPTDGEIAVTAGLG